MIINYAKTTEIVFHEPSPCRLSIFTPLTAKSLFVKLNHVNDKLSFEKHVTQLLARCRTVLSTENVALWRYAACRTKRHFCSLEVNCTSYCLAACPRRYLGLEYGDLNIMVLLTSTIYDFYGLLELEDVKMFENILMDHQVYITFFPELSQEILTAL